MYELNLTKRPPCGSEAARGLPQEAGGEGTQGSEEIQEACEEKMKVLVACEESQEVCKAFRALGHEAYSCDIEPCSGGHPEWHLQVDALEMLKMKWDMIIAFPPCTYMTNAGAVRMRVNGEIVPDRFEKAMAAKEFFLKFYHADCPKIAIENPTPMKIVGLPPYEQAIQPYWFGHPYSKRTCLWRTMSLLTGARSVGIAKQTALSVKKPRRR